jgi:hypothetical protein
MKSKETKHEKNNSFLSNISTSDSHGLAGTQGFL